MKYLLFFAGALLLLLSGINTINHKLQENVNRDYVVSGIPIIIAPENLFSGLYVSTHSATIFIEKRHFSSSNVAKIFRWYSLRYPDETDIGLAIVTDAALLEPFRPGQDPNEYSRLRPYEAICFRSEKGKNEFCRYYEEDINSAKSNTLIVKGMEPVPLATNSKITNLEKSVASVRIKSFTLENTTPSGIFKSFEAQSGSRSDWNPVFTIRTEDTLSPTQDYLHVVNAKTFYIVAHWIYAVTIDNGETWTIWDGMDRLKSLDCCPKDLIQSVKISQEGNGEMILKDQTGQASKLFTKDYGKTWKPSL